MNTRLQEAASSFPDSRGDKLVKDNSTENLSMYRTYWRNETRIVTIEAIKSLSNTLLFDRSLHPKRCRQEFSIDNVPILVDINAGEDRCEFIVAVVAVLQC